MKLVKQANGKKTIKISKSEWEDMGKKAGWMQKTAAVSIPAGQFELVVLEQSDGLRNRGLIAGISLHYKGDNYYLSNGDDPTGLFRELSEVFAPEIQVRWNASANLEALSDSDI